MVLLPLPPRRQLRHKGSFATLFDQFRNKTCPTSLMTRTNPSAIIAMKIFVKLDEIAPVGIGLKFVQTPTDGSPPRLICEENPDEST